MISREYKQQFFSLPVNINTYCFVLTTIKCIELIVNDMYFFGFYSSFISNHSSTLNNNKFNKFSTFLHIKNSFFLNGWNLVQVA